MTGERRRFAHVFATFGAGGPQVRAVQLMQHLGCDYEHVVMAMDGNIDARGMLPAGLSVQFAEPPGTRGFFATRRRQADWLREQQPDLLLTYNWGAIETVAAARKLGLALVHHEDGFLPDEAERRLRRRSWLRRRLLRSVPVIVPSLVLRGIAENEWGLRADDVHHLVNGVDLARFRPPVDRPGGDEIVLGSVGGLRPEKDHSNLLRAVAGLEQAVNICLVGSGPLAESLRAEARQLGIAWRVEFVGQSNDTAPYYGKFSIFVLSSRTEQMPIAMLEAMASGLPIVATDVGDVRAILPEAAQPYIVPREDADALAQALARLIADPSLRRRLGVLNRNAVEQHYQIAPCLDRFCAVYRTAMV